MTTAFYQYNDGVNAAFQQTFPSGIPDASVNNSDAVISAFPSFTTRASSAVDLGSITWHGTFIDDSYRGPAIGKLSPSIASRASVSQPSHSYLAEQRWLSNRQERRTSYGVDRP
jgi:hypothetical protein